MKVFLVIVLCGLVSLTCAEPQRYRSGRLRTRVLARQEVAPSEDPAPAPYASSGWRPEGATLELPTEQTEENVIPDYAPPTEYGSPAIVFTPETADESEAEELEAEVPVAEEPLEEEPEALEPEAEEFEGDEPRAEEVVPVQQSGRLRSPYVFLVNPAALRRAQIAQLRAPAQLRRARF